MPSVYKLNPDAERVSRRLREGFGWYPTSKDNEEQLRLFENSVARLKKELKGESKDKSITPSNMRKNFSWVYTICVVEGETLWKEVSSNLDTYKEMLPDLEACICYSHAIVFALEACFDTYLRNLMTKNDSNGGGHGQTHDGDHPESQGFYPPRSRSREYRPRDVPRSDVYGGGYSGTAHGSGHAGGHAGHAGHGGGQRRNDYDGGYGGGYFPPTHQSHQSHGGGNAHGYSDSRGGRGGKRF